VEEISDHEELCPAFSDPNKDCVCEIIYRIIVEEDFKKTECIQIAFDEGIEFQKEEILNKISDYRNMVWGQFDDLIESDQHHGTMLLYSGILDSIDTCKKIIEEA
jgi:hypothetical protein